MDAEIILIVFILIALAAAGEIARRGAEQN